RTDWIEPEQCAQEFRATGADQTSNANDLPTMKRERGLDRFASPGEARTLEDDVTRTSRGAGIKVMHVTADHVSNDRGMRCARDSSCCHAAPIAQDGITIAYRLHLFKEV